MPVPMGSPTAARRKASSTGSADSPGSQHSEPVLPNGPPLSPEFFVKAAASGFADGTSIYITSTGIPIPNAIPGQIPIMPQMSPPNMGQMPPMPSPQMSQMGPTPGYFPSPSHSGSNSGSPRQQPTRHQSMHHHHSPKLATDSFNSIPPPSPRITRMKTHTGGHSGSSRRTDSHSFVPPPFTSHPTWS